MIDRNLEKEIKQTKDFIELWRKFHDLYKGALDKQTISSQEEESFLETKSLLARNYQALLDSLNIKSTIEDKTFEVISQILSLDSISTISDMQMKKIENDWHNSYITLNKILGSLESKKEALAEISAVKIIIKRVFSSPVVSLALVIIIIIFIYYIIKVIILKGG